MKKILSLSLGIIALCLFFLPSNVRADKIKVVTTTDFYGQVAEEVLGNKGKVTSIINNPSVDPHDYEPTTQTAKQVSNANIVIYNGLGYDSWITKLSNGKKKIDVATDVMHAKDGDNEHLWYNSKTMGKLADYLVKEYAKLDPKNETYYKKNAEKYKQKLTKLQTLIAKIKKNSDNTYTLGVHIADVSYYVKEGSALDKEAMERGTSVYLVDRVIPMIPHELSNGICSLNPNVDRLAISCVMTIDSFGKLLDYDIFPSVIRSRIQMTYKKVNSILEKSIVPEGYEEFVDDLRLMAELASILRKMKVNRGYLDFDVDEAKILVDEACVPYLITKRERGIGENLIEDFMIAANECVATHIYNMDLPFIYRIHDVPKEEKIRDFLSFLSNLGYNVTGNLKGNKNSAIQKLLKFVHSKEEGPILTSLLLRCMQKAVYSSNNIGHFGLGSSCYTHFTSPIRRYPDTTVHRLLRTYLFNHDLSSHTINHYEEKLIYVADHSSAKERASIECEREVEDMKMAEYMEKHIGEEFSGIITSIMSFGMFVELDNLVEGLVPVRLMDDYFVYDEERMTLVGERSKIRYTIGEKVLIKVVAASKEAKTIDFKIIKKL